jgi:transglutaminase-like putative cysteine protease
VFVTPEQSSVKMIAEYLTNMSAVRSYSAIEQVWMAMEFVKAVPYAYDHDSKGLREYARFPAETLVDGEGDCEDHAALFVSIVRAMGFKAVQVYMTNGTDGHMAAAVAGFEAPLLISHYLVYQDVKYWFCEVTGPWGLPGLALLDLNEWTMTIVP